MPEMVVIVRETRFEQEARVVFSRSDGCASITQFSDEYRNYWRVWAEVYAWRAYTERLKKFGKDWTWTLQVNTGVDVHEARSRVAQMMREARAHYRKGRRFAPAWMTNEQAEFFYCFVES